MSYSQKVHKESDMTEHKRNLKSNVVLRGLLGGTREPEETEAEGKNMQKKKKKKGAKSPTEGVSWEAGQCVNNKCPLRLTVVAP